MAVSAFEVSGLSFRYEKRAAVECLSLEIFEGEAVAFVGPNGSGKTTMLKLLNGLVGPFQGKIDFMGRPLAGNPDLRRRSVYVHQHPILFAGTVRDNLAYALRLKRVDPASIPARVLDVALRLRLDGILDREAGKLSGGETQRVAIARAVAAGADVLLLDEPTSSLDADGEVEVRKLLSELKRSGSTILFSAHDPGLVAELADRIAAIEAGVVGQAAPSASTAPSAGRTIDARTCAQGVDI